MQKFLDSLYDFLVAAFIALVWGKIFKGIYLHYFT